MDSTVAQRWREVCRFKQVEVAACWSFLALGPLSNTHVCLVAEALCLQLRGGGDDMRPRMLLSGVTTFPYQHKPRVILPASPPTPPHPSTPGSFSCGLFLHLLPRGTLIVPTAINTSLSMWQPCVPRSPSQRSHWPRDCEKLQQALDSHIHMEIWVYKYGTGAAGTAAQTPLALRTEQRGSHSATMAPTVVGQAGKDHLTPAHKVNLASNKSMFFS